IKLRRVNSPPARRIHFLRHDRMQHLVIKYVFEKPTRNKRLIEQGMDPDHPIFLLNRTENEIFLGTLFAPPAPHHAITTQASAKMAIIHALKNSAEIKVTTFMSKIELTLHRQRWPGCFLLCLFLCHQKFPCRNGVERQSILVLPGQTDKEPSLGEAKIS